MNDLLMLIAIVIASIGTATIVLALCKIIIIALPEILVRTVSGNSVPSIPARQRSADQDKAGSCPFCSSGS